MSSSDGGDGVAEVQRAGDVGRRHGDHKGRLVVSGSRANRYSGLKIALRFPPIINTLLRALRIIRLGHFHLIEQLFHSQSLALL